MTAVSIAAGGLVSAVGFNAAASCAAIRAGVRGIEATNLFDPASGSPVPAGRVELPQWWEGTGKLAELVAPAIAECLRVGGARWQAEQIPILLGVPGKDRPHRFDGIDDELLDEVEFRLKVPHHPLSGTIPRDQVSAAIGIRHAGSLIAQRAAPACIVAGVDSLLRQVVVKAYADRRRVMTDDNANGFFPGEAGSAVLVTEPGALGGPRLNVLGIGFAREPGAVETTVPCRGEGLTQAIRQAVDEAHIDFGTIAFRVTDLNGEHYKFKEATIAIGRMETRPHHDPFDLWHPIEYLGEIGAAIGPTALTVAMAAGAKGYAPGAVALFHFGSDGGERAAIVTRYTVGDPQ